MTKLGIIASTGVIALMLSACTKTIDVVLETGDNGRETVSAMAEAPTDIEVIELIEETNKAMYAACQRPGTDQQLIDGLPDPEEIKDVIKIVSDLIPMNTYKATRNCPGLISAIAHA